ncbi:MAG TPA: FIST N-terminal domain-containing protein [Solirubrobacteraceae bacterium]|nr:FIST N-terminal domain-containing protein [Solirubrobacteraceae bacterium]
MSVRIGAGLSRTRDARVGAIEAAQAAASGLAGARADVAVVFACGDHLAAPEAVLEGVHEALCPAQLVGCGASGVLADGAEVEDGTAVAVWAAALDGGSVRSFRANAPHGDDDDDEEETGPTVDVKAAANATAVLVFPDAYSFDTEAMLAALRESCPQVPVLGGLASARTFDGTAALFHDESVLEQGAVGLLFEGVPVHTCVSQGASPLGPELTITAAEGQVIHELAGKPALVKLREVFDELDERERALVAGGLFLGIVIDAGKPEYEHGDFLVRGVVGADTEQGSVALSANLRAGQVVRLHARDARSADRDLERALRQRRATLGERSPAGALCFTCNGRGRGLFGVPDHDASALARALAGAPVAGFFAAGEIGPVSGESFQHAFSASVAVFAG